MRATCTRTVPRCNITCILCRCTRPPARPRNRWCTFGQCRLHPRLVAPPCGSLRTGGHCYSDNHVSIPKAFDAYSLIYMPYHLHQYRNLCFTELRQYTKSVMARNEPLWWRQVKWEWKLLLLYEFLAGIHELQLFFLRKMLCDHFMLLAHKAAQVITPKTLLPPNQKRKEKSNMHWQSCFKIEKVNLLAKE